MSDSPACPLCGSSESKASPASGYQCENSDCEIIRYQPKNRDDSGQDSYQSGEGLPTAAKVWGDRKETPKSVERTPEAGLEIGDELVRRKDVPPKNYCKVADMLFFAHSPVRCPHCGSGDIQEDGRHELEQVKNQ